MMSVQKLRHLNDGLDARSYKYADTWTRKQVKQEIVDDLADRARLIHGDVNSVIKQWSKSSDGEDMRSLALQQDTSKEFGVPMTDHLKTKIRTTQVLTAGMTGTEPLLETGRQRRLLRAMYNATQESLKQAGFEPGDKIRLQRGVNLPADVTADWGVDSVVKIQSNPLSSWTADTSTEIASRFARYSANYKKPGYILEMEVPVSAIFSTARTGFGCLTEAEYVVLGGEHEARVVRVYGK